MEHNTFSEDFGVKEPLQKPNNKIGAWALNKVREWVVSSDSLVTYIRPCFLSHCSQTAYEYS